MKDLIRYIASIFNRKKTHIPESDISSDEDVELEVGDSGCIAFQWDSKTGDFQVTTTVDDESEASSEVLGMLLAYISEGHMRSFLMQSLKLWAEDSDDKDKSNKFYINTLRVWSMMNELDVSQDQEEMPIISPIDVFRLSRRDNSV